MYFRFAHETSMYIRYFTKVQLGWTKLKIWTSFWVGFFQEKAMLVNDSEHLLCPPYSQSWQSCTSHLCQHTLGVGDSQPRSVHPSCCWQIEAFHWSRCLSWHLSFWCWFASLASLCTHFICLAFGGNFDCFSLGLHVSESLAHFNFASLRSRWSFYLWTCLRCWPSLVTMDSHFLTIEFRASHACVAGPPFHV